MWNKLAEADKEYNSHKLFFALWKMNESLCTKFNEPVCHEIMTYNSKCA